MKLYIDSKVERMERKTVGYQCDSCGQDISEDWGGKKFRATIQNSWSDGYENFGRSVKFDFCGECAATVFAALPGLRIEKTDGDSWWVDKSGDDERSVSRPTLKEGA